MVKSEVHWNKLDKDKSGSIRQDLKKKTQKTSEETGRHHLSVFKGLSHMDFF